MMINYMFIWHIYNKVSSIEKGPSRELKYKCVPRLLDVDFMVSLYIVSTTWQWFKKEKMGQMGWYGHILNQSDYQL